MVEEPFQQSHGEGPKCFTNSAGDFWASCLGQMEQSGMLVWGGGGGRLAAVL